MTEKNYPMEKDAMDRPLTLGRYLRHYALGDLRILPEEFARVRREKRERKARGQAKHKRPPVYRDGGWR